MILSKMRVTKALIRLLGCAGWSAAVLLANHRRQVFSRRGPYYALSFQPSDAQKTTYLPVYCILKSASSHKFLSFENGTSYQILHCLLRWDEIICNNKILARDLSKLCMCNTSPIELKGIF